MTAVMRHAMLVVEDGCVRLQPADGHASALAVFPYDYSIARQGAQYRILTRRGATWGETGVTQNIGGGGVMIDMSRVRPDASRCAGSYWIVGTYCTVGKRVIEQSCPSENVP